MGILGTLYTAAFQFKTVSHVQRYWELNGMSLQLNYIGIKVYFCRASEQNISITIHLIIMHFSCILITCEFLICLASEQGHPCYPGSSGVAVVTCQRAANPAKSRVPFRIRGSANAATHALASNEPQPHPVPSMPVSSPTSRPLYRCPTCKSASENPRNLVVCVDGTSLDRVTFS